MNTPRPLPSFSFHIESGEPQAGNAIAATVLVQILHSAQQAFSLIGVHVEGRSIKTRARVPPQTSARFQLICQLPKPGCYAVPVTIGDAEDLTQREAAEGALRIFQNLMHRISDRSVENWAEVLPDERIRRRVLEHVKGMAPRAGAKWTLSLHDDQDRPFAALDPGTIPFIQAALVPEEEREASRVVTGELKNIDFFERKITLIYPPTNRELECFYDEALEDLLYERRRDLIQVTGRVVLGEHGQPKQIIDVTDIRDIDLTPFELTRIEYGSLRLDARSPLVLEPTLDDSKQLLCVEHEDLGLCAFAQTREALVNELAEQMAMLWREYAQADAAELDAPAQQLKHSLLAGFVEVTDAA
jgi:hypothetical protein